MGIRNLVGDLLGYARCPITNDTYWNSELASVPYSEESGLVVSVRVLKEVPKEEIATQVFNHTRNWSTTSRRFSLQEIVERIPEGCTILPKFASF